MKKLNQKGFSHLEIALIIVVFALIGGAGYYVLKQNNKHQNSTATTASTTPDTASSSQAPTTLKEYKNTEHGFSFQYPSNWKLTEKLEASNRGEGTNRTEGEVTVTSPSGTVVHFGPNFGGKGGECFDDQTGTETTRTCATLTVYSAEKVQTTSGVEQVYYYQASVTQPLRSGGQTSYMVFISNNTFFPKQPGSILGVIFMPFDEIHTNKSEITVYVDGKEASLKNTKAYFDSAEAKEATPILKSFRTF